MVTEYNRNTIIKRRMAELERKEKTSCRNANRGNNGKRNKSRE